MEVSRLKKEFTTVLQKIPDLNAAYFCLPFDAEEEYGKRHMIKVKATIDGVLYRGTLVNMGLGTMLGVNQEIRKKIGKNPGDTIHVILEQDTDERTIEIPDDVTEKLLLNKEATDFFESLSFTNRKEYIRWITGAKRDDTRVKRLDKMILLLLNKKRNPSEK